MIIQDIDAFIKEESNMFEEAKDKIAEVLPVVKQTNHQSIIRDIRLTLAVDDWSENKLKVPPSLVMQLQKLNKILLFLLTSII